MASYGPEKLLVCSQTLALKSVIVFQPGCDWLYYYYLCDNEFPMKLLQQLINLNENYTDVKVKVDK